MATAHKISIWIKLAYAAPAFGGAAMALPIVILMPRFYTDSVLVPISFIALGIAFARSLDALTDPIMGWVTDHTAIILPIANRRGWGRRKPWILLSAPFVAVLFFMLFSPPESLTINQAGLWFVATFTLYFLFQTVETVPTVAWGAEITDDYQERSSVFAIRAAFIAIGTMLAAISPFLLQTVFGLEDERLVYQVMALIFIVFFLLGVGAQTMFVPNPTSTIMLKRSPLVPGARRALRNRPFRIILAAAVVGSIPGAIPAILAPYFVEHVVGAEEPLSAVGLFLFSYLTMGILFIAFWMFLAKRVGKLATLIISNSWMLIGNISLFFVADYGFVPTLIVFALIGAGSMAGQFLIPSMVADVIDYDQLLTQRRREAQYVAFLGIIPKFVGIPGASVPLALLALVGYVPNQVQTPEVILAINLLTTLFPAVFFIASLVIVARYPISEKIYQQIRQGLDLHDNQQAAVDPITQQMILPPDLKIADPENPTEDESRWYYDYFSQKELNLVLQSSAQHLIKHIQKLLIINSLAFIGFVLISLQLIKVTDFADWYGLMAVIFVVASGLTVTVIFYQAARLKAARQPELNNRQAIQVHLKSASDIFPTKTAI